MRRRRACPECDLVVTLPPLHAGEAASCPRCDHELAYRPKAPAERVLAYSVSAVIMLMLTLLFPFMQFSLGSSQTEIVLLDTATAFRATQWPALAVVIIATIVILPGMYLLAVTYVYAGIASRRYLPGSIWLARALSHIKPWLMTDVFLVGVLVSLVKLLSMASISLGPSFWAFCAYVVCMVKAVSNVDSDWMWFALKGEPKTPYVAVSGTDAWSQGLVGCRTCGLLNRIEQGHCRRCARRIRVPGRHSIEHTWGLLIAASILYVPANLYPMMRTQSLIGVTESTILGGVWQMVELGSYFVAAVIFFASIVIPVAKIIVLAWLCLVVQRARAGADPMTQQQRMRWYRIVEFIGRWSMIDVFVVAIMVALIQAGVILSIQPGPAALAFAAVVILTMLAAMAFDPKALWQPHRVAQLEEERMHEQSH
ncbi:MAG: paraquat-inducible protein A [Firmicutes bacterium]|nr:paraquat-inducible protein A [Bacillota bacterium]